jgi:hypothetical protein
MVRKVNFVIIFFLVLFLSFSVEYKDNQKIKAKGIITLVDSEPFTRIAVRVGKDNIFFLPQDKKLKKMINKEINFEARIKVIKLESADGKYTVVEYHLENFKILK